MRGEDVDLATLAGYEVNRLISRAEDHGALPLVAERVTGRSGIAADLRERLADRARRHAMLDLAQERELRHLLGQFRAHGVRTLLIKGAHLAYSHYARSDLRPRLDTDVFVHEQDRQRALDVLQGEGYEGTGHVAGTLVMYQACFIARGHVVDLHWKVANPQVFARLVSYNEFEAEATPLPALDPGARGLSDVHALLVACIHRVAHHYDTDRLIWLYDIHLLASRLSSEQWGLFADLCLARGVTQVCRRGLVRASAAFGTTIPPRLWESGHGPLSEAEAATSAFLDSGRRHVNQVVGDLRALPSWRDRARLVGQHVFPAADYMRRSYAPASSAPLAFLYLRRAVAGAWKWIARP